MLGRRSSPFHRLPMERPGFTPSQIIRLVLAVGFVVMALPIGAKAAGSLVTIVDSSTTTQARVDSATNSLRVGGATFKVLDKSGTLPAIEAVTFTFTSWPYSQIRIFAESPGCAGTSCAHLSMDCVEGTARTCILIPTATFDEFGFNQVQVVPGRTVRVAMWNIGGGLSYHIVVYGRAP